MRHVLCASEMAGKRQADDLSWCDLEVAITCELLPLNLQDIVRESAKTWS